MQERPLDFSLKSNMAKTAPNFACQFVDTCRKLPCTYFPLFLLRIPESMQKHLHVAHYEQGLKAFEARPEGTSNKRIFVYLHVFVSELLFSLPRIWDW